MPKRVTEGMGRQQRLLPEMDLMLRVTLLSLLCLLAEARPSNRPQQNGRWNPLEVPENRELFLSALQNYFSSRGIHAEPTAGEALSWQPPAVATEDPVRTQPAALQPLTRRHMLTRMGVHTHL
ncbi:hypothetical protein Y1Q_0008598 [Alligator mississippiensis]|uniref:Uncharacterized protein n=1 Tax=Alligator mississippiensis TaxID=8496 RepID=A0A151N9D5_ALLMI|nr:hypothetical protein Y1Q_0008598 [Alligator mississippiensis]